MRRSSTRRSSAERSIFIFAPNAAVFANSAALGGGRGAPGGVVEPDVAGKFPVLSTGAAGRELSVRSGLLSATAAGIGVTLPILSSVLPANEQPASTHAEAIMPSCERRLNM